MSILVNNKKVFFEYEILEKFEAGISLLGWEVKSLKANHGSLVSSYIKEKNGEMFIVGMNIPVWKTSNYIDPSLENRDRKLLLKKREISNLASKAKQDRLTIVPLEVSKTKSGLIKLEIALAKGKRKFDKRQKLKDRDLKKRIDQDRKEYNF